MIFFINILEPKFSRNIKVGVKLEDVLKRYLSYFYIFEFSDSLVCISNKNK